MNASAEIETKSEINLTVDSQDSKEARENVEQQKEEQSAPLGQPLLEVGCVSNSCPILVATDDDLHSDSSTFPHLSTLKSLFKQHGKLSQVLSSSLY